MDQVALFHTPYTPPKRTAREIFAWLVAQGLEADRLGFAEFWVGEHATVQWEGVPNPELVLAAVAREAKQIILAPGAHLLPYHHPATLAIQVSWMTHLTEGRYILGIGAGAFPGDGILRGLKDLSQNHRMVAESIEIMKRVWAAEPFEFTGEFWKAGHPKVEPNALAVRDVRPYGGQVRMGISGLSPDSPSLKFAGSKGYLPLSIFTTPEQIGGHWSLYSKAAKAAEHTPNRKDHHVVMDIFVGDSDAQARRDALDGPMGAAWSSFVFDGFKHYMPAVLKDIPPNANRRTEIECVADKVWVVGTPDTVVKKICEKAEAAGGPWGTTMMFGYDYSENPGPWNRSLKLMASEVLPRLKKAFARMA